ncbi:DUF5994 family protein [Streptomyces sp. HO565]|uniref:DUF5994 family protein n=1 Tax=Streptomyces TaxID=1883 RepID=UPI0038B58138
MGAEFPRARRPNSGHERADEVRDEGRGTRLKTTESREGVLDGAWWLRSRTVAAGVPALLSALGPSDRGVTTRIVAAPDPPGAASSRTG